MPSQEEQNQGEAWLPEPTVQGTGHLQDYHSTRQWGQAQDSGLSRRFPTLSETVVGRAQ